MSRTSRYHAPGSQPYRRDKSDHKIGLRQTLSSPKGRGATISRLIEVIRQRTGHTPDDAELARVLATTPESIRRIRGAR
jgi:hypothetical protein